MHLYKYLERAQVMNAKILWQGWVEVEEDMKMCPAGGWTSEIVADFGVVEWMMNNEVDEEECHVIESGEWPERGRNALNRGRMWMLMNVKKHVDKRSMKDGW